MDVHEWADVGMGVSTCVHTDVGSEVNLIQLVFGGT